jgi:histidinol phosphatase-like enzyme (inositol monophosphatase family)
VPPPVEPELVDLAVDAARAGGGLTLGWFRTADLQVRTKADRTPVTAADEAAEQEIRRWLRDARPEDGVLGEEEGEVAGSSGLTWVVDPIDGTQGFTRGVPLYSTLVALVDQHGPALGVIHLPALGTTLWAGRGTGCQVDGRPARVSAVDSLADALLTTSGFDAFDTDRFDALRRTGCRLRTWGDGYGYYLVATGAADVMVDPVASRWDLAPMPVILAEAGGTFTDVAGTTTFDSSGVASNGLLHDDVLAALATPDGSRRPGVRRLTGAGVQGARRRTAAGGPWARARRRPGHEPGRGARLSRGRRDAEP